MTKFKALLYKELVISKKSLILQVLSFSFLMLFGWAIALSFEIGNLGKVMDLTDDEEMVRIIANTVFYMFNYIGIYIATCFLMNNKMPISDVQSNWRTFSFTMPVNNHHKAAVAVFMKICNIVTGLAVSILNAVVLSAILDVEFEMLLNIKVFAIMLLFGIILDCTSSFFVYRARTVKEANIAAFANLGMAAVIMVGVIFYFKPKLDMGAGLSGIISEAVNVIDSAGIWAMLLVPVLLAVNYFICCRAMDRRYD